MNGSRPVVVYISAASDLMAERDALARMIATLPVTLAWRVVQTPLEAEALDLPALQATDLHFLVMGTDIRAPVGLEWDAVRYGQRPSVAFLKQNAARTPAGQVFVHDASVVWQSFTDAADLSRQVRRLVVEHLLQRAARYALTPTEVEQLEALRTVEKPTDQPAESESAGRSAVILSRERYVPSEGVIVDESEPESVSESDRHLAS
jgi:hypothetical protein